MMQRAFATSATAVVPRRVVLARTVAGACQKRRLSHPQQSSPNRPSNQVCVRVGPCQSSLLCAVLSVVCLDIVRTLELGLNTRMWFRAKIQRCCVCRRFAAADTALAPRVTAHHANAPLSCPCCLRSNGKPVVEVFDRGWLKNGWQTLSTLCLGCATLDTTPVFPDCVARAIEEGGRVHVSQVPKVAVYYVQSSLFSSGVLEAPRGVGAGQVVLAQSSTDCGAHPESGM